MPIQELHEVKVGDRVSYEDRANPRQEGVVTELVSTTISGSFGKLDFGTQYRVSFEAVLSGFATTPEEHEQWSLPARETVSDLRQHGWNRAERVAA